VTHLRTCGIPVIVALLLSTGFPPASAREPDDAAPAPADTPEEPADEPRDPPEQPKEPESRLELASPFEKPTASGFAFGPYVRYYVPLGLGGTALADQDASWSTTLSLDEDLGLGPVSSIWEFGGRIGGWTRDWRFWLQASYLRGRIRDRMVPGAPFVFNGTSFPAGQSVLSSFRFDVAQILIEAHPQELAPDSPLDVGIHLGSIVAGAELAMESAGAKTDEGTRVPAFGGGVSLAVMPAEWLSFEGRAGYYADILSVVEYLATDDATDVRSSVWDLSIAARVHPFRFATAEIGLRYLDVYEKTKTDREYNEIAWALGSFYVGASVRF
jgi:hypothetical protein